MSENNKCLGCEKPLIEADRKVCDNGFCEHLDPAESETG